jgi:MFS family permease
MVVLGVIVFATASGLCGATPTGSLDQAWLIAFRIIQGASAAIMFPAALAIVLGASRAGTRSSSSPPMTAGKVEEVAEEPGAEPAVSSG